MAANERPDNERALNADDVLMVATVKDTPTDIEELTQVKNQLVSTIESRFYDAERGRKSDESRWLKAYHNYRGVYGKDVKFRENENSRVFVKITKTKVEGMEKTMREGYITKEEFDPIKKIVYGLVGLILLGAGGILVDLIFASKQVVP